MTHASLFSGIGGFDLAAEWAGWENIFHCEWNPFGQKVLKHHFPNSISYNDITKTDFTIHAGQIDILTGGFPCQPYSTAGKRLGTEDERHLWPEMLRTIREVQPRWVVGENVRGLTNWNGGMVFDEVQSNLEDEGYEVLPFLLPACAVNAPHRRDRIWFIAHSNNKGKCAGPGQIQRKDEEISEWNNDAKLSDTSNENVTNSNGKGFQRRQDINKFRKYNKEGAKDGFIFRTTWANNYEFTKCDFQNFPSKPPLCGGDDGLPRELDGITFPKWRNESIKAYGNAIVPQVAYQIFKTINEFENI